MKTMKYSLLSTAILLSLKVCLGDIPTEDFDEAKDNYYKWLNSNAGAEALNNGYFKPQRSEEANVNRFYESYNNMKELQKENRNAELSMHTPFAMMSSQDFLRIFGRTQGNDYIPPATSPSNPLLAPKDDVQQDIDWTTKSSCVGGVRNQFQCGSCWAFAAVGALESAYCLKTGRYLSLAEQQLVSCNNKNYGCGGGWVNVAYTWMLQNNSQGLCSNEEYPYQAKDTKCRQCDVRRIKMKSYVQLHHEKEAHDALQKEPLAVYVEVTKSWAYYKGGLLNISNGSVNHVVLLIGYDSSQGGIWKIRNSWGTNWGINGYLLTQVGLGAIQYPIYPVF